MTKIYFGILAILIMLTGCATSTLEWQNVARRGTKAGELVLTGVVAFSTDASGAAGGQIWNTLGGDGRWNLYVTRDNLNAPFLNSGNGLGARINVPLPVGTHTFFLFAQPDSDPGRFGLNIFFNGDDTTPGISVFAPTDLPPSPPFPAFLANSNSATLQLNSSRTHGAGTLTFVDGTFTVTLTNYRWSRPEVETTNRVQAFNNVPGSGNDFVGQFTLTVVAGQ